MFMNRVEEFYGRDCVLHYGDWSRKDGCAPSLGVGLKKMLAKRFEVEEVDEYKTSKTCNLCPGEMKRYKKRDSHYSHSRLFCENCAGRQNKDRSKRFADRDLNAAANILLIPQTREEWFENEEKAFKRIGDAPSFKESKIYND